MLLVRALVVSLALGILLASLAADAQQVGKVFRIGWLGGGSLSTAAHWVEALRQGLREQGWVEGQNVTIEYRWAEGKLDRLPALVAELVRLKVDIIVVTNTPGAVAAKRATTTIPIVFVGPEPISVGLVTSLARPGGNITGLTLVPGPELVGKYLEIIKDAVPNLSRVAVLWNRGHQLHPLMLREAEVAARALRLQLQSVGVKGADDFGGGFAAMTKERASAVVVLPDPLFFLHRRQLAELAARSRLPAMYGVTEHVEDGGLMAYSAKFADLARRAAIYVDRILKGAKPADLPVEQPTRFELIVNLKTAKALGLTIPASVLMRADQVIK